MTTIKQQETLDTLVRLINEKGYPPTVRELADELDVQPATVQQSLSHLRSQGLANNLPKSARSWLPT